MTVSEGTTAREIDAGPHRVVVRTRPTDAASTPESRTVLVVHAAGQAVPAPLLEDLPGDLRVVAVGAVDASADDVTAAADALGLGAVHVVGWTDGVAAAVAFATRHPVRSLTAHPAQADAVPVDAASLRGLGGGEPVATWVTDADDLQAFRRTVLQTIGYIGPAHNPAPPTEAIILKSED